MEHYTPRDHATSNVLAWTTTNSANVEPSVEEDAGADTDEPPDNRAPMSPISSHFHRTPIRRGSEQHESLLTKALQNQSDEEDADELESLRQRQRRRSITSNASFASTAELTCGTGFTTPARTTSPSPRVPNVGFVHLAVPAAGDAQRNVDAAVRALEKKRCISFACAAKPRVDEKMSVTPPPRANPDEARVEAPPKKASIKFACAAKPKVEKMSVTPPPRANLDEARVEAPPKKTSIKFACASRPPRTADVPQIESQQRTPVPRVTPSTPKGPPNLQKQRSSSTIRAFRSPTSRRSPGSPMAARKTKWLSADSGDLEGESSRFHEFASEELQEDDWIRRDYPSMQPKLTIDDTLKKELAIRKLGREAEEEAELEDQIDQDEEDDEEVDDADLIDDDDNDDGDDNADGDDFDDDGEGHDDDDDHDDDDEEDQEDDAGTEQVWRSEASDGYKTDNETGFAESDDEDDDLVLWTTRIGQYPLSGAVLMARRSSQGDHSDSSTSSNRKSSKKRRSKTRPVPFRSETPELPDSTDFVCGTLDEDKPLEEAYISCVEARKRGRHQAIPQDIDPSFPTSEPEDEEEETYSKGYGDSEGHIWLHGELEDLHHERDRRGRKKKGANPSPLRCRSPPPRRRSSPAPKARGRSPRKLSAQRSPRLRSPAPLRKSPIVSPSNDGDDIAFRALAFRPGLVQTKSLPKTPGMFPHLKARKLKTGAANGQTHVRGAIDIVKGLEQKRQRRKEKYFQKYYNRARKEKAQTKRPPRGQGAERMRELGLLMAGKVGHGNYVLSI